MFKLSENRNRLARGYEVKRVNNEMVMRDEDSRGTLRLDIGCVHGVKALLDP
jgi:hypothetical protein